MDIFNNIEIFSKIFLSIGGISSTLYIIVSYITNVEIERRISCVCGHDIKKLNFKSLVSFFSFLYAVCISYFFSYICISFFPSILSIFKKFYSYIATITIPNQIIVIVAIIFIIGINFSILNNLEEHIINDIFLYKNIRGLITLLVVIVLILSISPMILFSIQIPKRFVEASVTIYAILIYRFSYITVEQFIQNTKSFNKEIVLITISIFYGLIIGSTTAPLISFSIEYEFFKLLSIVNLILLFLFFISSIAFSKKDLFSFKQKIIFSDSKKNAITGIILSENKDEIFVEKNNTIFRYKKSDIFCIKEVKNITK